MAKRKSSGKPRKAERVTLDDAVSNALGTYTADGLHSLAMDCGQIVDRPWRWPEEEEGVSLQGLRSRLASFAKGHPDLADLLDLEGEGLAPGTYRYALGGEDRKVEAYRCMPVLRLVRQDCERRIREGDWGQLLKAEGFLAACASHQEAYGDAEAIVYLASRGRDCTEYAATIRNLWREAADEAITKLTKPVWGSTLGKGKDGEFKVRDGIPLEEAREVRRWGSNLLRNFWGGRLEQDWTIDATMLRAAEWADVGGFDSWWERWAKEIRESVAQAGVSPVEGGLHLFSLCRSDLAIRLLGDTLDRYLWGVTVGEIEKEAPWRLWTMRVEPARQIDHYLVAAAIAFGACRLPSVHIDPAIAESAAKLLLANQSASGGWPTAGDETESDIIATAMAVHALCLKRPLGWRVAARKAADWLWQHQDPFGYWYEEGCPDTVYMTVLVLDAIELASGGTRVTFRLPGRERLHDVGFSFLAGQVFYNGNDIDLPTGLPIKVLKNLHEHVGKVVTHQDLHDESRPSEASEQLRSAVKQIRAALKKHEVRYEVQNKRSEGYMLRPR